MNQEKTNEPLSKTAVSGSFDIEDVKWLLFYGHTKDGKIDLNTETKGELDYFITQMFLTMRETYRFNVDIAEDVFWKRIVALANYR